MRELRFHLFERRDRLYRAPVRESRFAEKLQNRNPGVNLSPIGAGLRMEAR